MNPRMKGSVVIVFLLLMCLSAGEVKASEVATSPIKFFDKVVVVVNSRKLMRFEELLDYDTGPNPKHDPRGGKKGGVGIKVP